TGTRRVPRPAPPRRTAPSGPGRFVASFASFLGTSRAPPTPALITPARKVLTPARSASKDVLAGAAGSCANLSCRRNIVGRVIDGKPRRGIGRPPAHGSRRDA